MEKVQNWLTVKSWPTESHTHERKILRAVFFLTSRRFSRFLRWFRAHSEFLCHCAKVAQRKITIFCGPWLEISGKDWRYCRVPKRTFMETLPYKIQRSSKSTQHFISLLWTGYNLLFDLRLGYSTRQDPAPGPISCSATISIACRRSLTHLSLSSGELAATTRQRLLVYTVKLLVADGAIVISVSSTCQTNSPSAHRIHVLDLIDWFVFTGTSTQKTCVNLCQSASWEPTLAVENSRWETIHTI